MSAGFSAAPVLALPRSRGLFPQLAAEALHPGPGPCPVTHSSFSFNARYARRLQWGLVIYAPRVKTLASLIEPAYEFALIFWINPAALRAASRQARDLA